MIIDGKKIAMELKEDIRKRASRLKVCPGFGVVIVGDDPASLIYVERKCVMAQELGFYFKKIHLPSTASQKKVIAALDALSADVKIHGIILQVPLPPHIALDEVSHHIDQQKDIDCFHPDNLARLFLNKQTTVPPTPEAVLRLIQSTRARLDALDVVVIGDGFFSRQITAHCLNQGAVVTLVHSKAKNLSRLTLGADVVITAVGKPNFLTGSMVKHGAVVIDVGITKKGKSVVGDCDFESVFKKARAITPVPGGVGPLTVAVLMENVLSAAMNLTN